MKSSEKNFATFADHSFNMTQYHRRTEQILENTELGDKEHKLGIVVVAKIDPTNQVENSTTEILKAQKDIPVPKKR